MSPKETEKEPRPTATYSHLDSAPVSSILIIDALLARNNPQLALEFSRKGARISLPYLGEEENQSLALAAAAARRGAIVKPLDMSSALPEESSGEERAISWMLQRVVEDFGRIDMVIVSKDSATQAAFGSLEDLASASLPYLKKSRPMGHFVLLASSQENKAPLREELQLLESARARKRQRCRIVAVMASGSNGLANLLEQTIESGQVLELKES